jgi:hypothetical protein
VLSILGYESYIHSETYSPTVEFYGIYLNQNFRATYYQTLFEVYGVQVQKQKNLSDTLFG